MAVNNALTTKQNGSVEVAPRTLSAWLGSPKGQAFLKNALVNDKAIEKYTSSLLSAVSTNPALQKCDFVSTVSAGLLANALDLSLSPQLGYAYLVPFEDRKNNRTIATFILGYKGYIQLAIRSGYYKKIIVLPIKEGEFVSYNALEESLVVNLFANEEEREKAPAAGYYAMFEHVNGFKKVLYWSKAKMEAHARRYSRGYANDLAKHTAYTFWSTDFDGMAQKTLIRQLLSKWGIMSIELQKAYDADTESMARQESNITVDFPEINAEQEFFGEADIVDAEPADEKYSNGDSPKKRTAKQESFIDSAS